MNLFMPTLATVIIGILPAHASPFGNSSGGGGKGVVCRNNDKSIKSVEILDLWEARVLRQETPHAVTGNLAQDVDGTLSRLKFSISQTISETDGPNGKTSCQNADCIIKELREYAQPFLSKADPSILRLRAVSLELTLDSFELVRPDGDCAIEQIVDYQPSGGPILINEDLFEKMDTANQATLIAHEAFYQLLKFYYGEPNSIRVRRAIGFVSSGDNKLISLPEMPFKKGQILCESEPEQNVAQPYFALPSNALIFSSDFSEVDFRSVSGTAVLGVSDRVRKNTSAYYKSIVQGVLEGKSCPGLSTELHLDGPVEYDRDIVLMRNCAQGKQKLSIAVRNPGDSTYTTRQLTCRALEKPYPL